MFDTLTTWVRLIFQDLYTMAGKEGYFFRAEEAPTSYRAAFDGYRIERNWVVFRAMVLLEMVGFLFHWPSDFILFGDHEMLLGFAIGRFVTIVSCALFLGLASVVGRSTLLKRGLMTAYWMSFPVVYYAFLSLASQPGQAFWWVGYGFAMVMVIWLFPLRARMVAMGGIYGGMVLAAWLASPPQLRNDLTFTALRVGIVYFFLTVFMGHAFFTIVRANFFQQQHLVDQQATVQRLNEALQGRLRDSMKELLQVRWDKHFAEQAERARLERELHDDLNGFQVQQRSVLRKLSQGDLEDTQKAQLEQLTEAVNSFDNAVRRAFRDLPPQVLDDLGLRYTLEFLTDSFRSRTGTDTELVIEPEQLDMPDAFATCIVRVVQEALVNIERHAQATKAEVALLHVEGGLLVAVRDDGVGLPENLPGGRIGLRGMEARVEELGGSFCIESAPGEGTEMRVILPFPEVNAV